MSCPGVSVRGPALLILVELVLVAFHRGEVPGFHPVDLRPHGVLQPPAGITEKLHGYQPSASRSWQKIGAVHVLPCSGDISHAACCGTSNPKFDTIAYSS